MRIETLSLKQRQLLLWAFREPSRSEDKAIICDGSVRAGKTIIMIMAFVLWAMRNFDRANFGICGKTVQSAERNIIRPLREIENLTCVFDIRYHASAHMLTVACGGRENQFFVFGGKDESSYQLIQGITLSGILYDEVALMPRSFVDQGNARTLSVPGAKLWFNCNPESQMHWFNQEWVIPSDHGERRARHLHFTMEDNPILSPEMIAEAKALYTGVFYDRYILGLWVAAEGLIYDCFDRTRHVRSDLPETEGSSYVSIDYGTQNPTVFLLWRRQKGAERWICLREYYYSGREKRRQKTDSEFADDLAAWLGGVQPRAVVVDPSAASFIAELRQRGFPVQKADNDVLDGIRETAALLKNGALVFSDTCVQTQAEFGAYVWDEKAAMRGEDRPVKEHDHCMDAVRYFVNTVLRRGQVRAKRRPRGM